MEKSLKELFKRVRWRRIGGTFCIAIMLLALLLCVWGTDQAGSEAGGTVLNVNGSPIEPDTGPSDRQLAAQEAFSASFLAGTEEDQMPEVSSSALNKKLSTEYVVLYDVTHSQILYTKNADQRCYPASTTKLLTASVAAKFCAPDTEFVVGDELSLVAYDSSLALLQKGQRLTFEMLLDALLLPSGNDAAYVMAAGVGRLYAGDDSLPAEEAVAVFVGLMNQTAQRIGATDSHFVTPDGYHDDDHYTTAMDMMRIALYASTFDVVRESYGKSEASHTLLTGEEYYWENSNPLINDWSSCFYTYATGMKTGFTDQAGSCLVASAEKDGIEMIAVTMNALSIDARNNDLRTMFDAAFASCEKIS